MSTSVPHLVDTNSTSSAPKSGELRLLTVKEVAAILGTSPRTIWRMLKKRTFPRPVRFGRNTRWEYHSISEWILQRQRS